MQYLGIDWAYRRAAWCARSDSGAIVGEGFVPADEDGLVRLVTAAGAGKVRDIAPLACKTEKVDVRVLSELCRRDLVPALWVPSLDDRALRERLRRRMHVAGLRASAQNRIFGLLTQWGLRVSLKRLREPDAMAVLQARGVEEAWRRSIQEALAVIDLLDEADRAVAGRVAAARSGRPACRAPANHSGCR